MNLHSLQPDERTTVPASESAGQPKEQDCFVYILAVDVTQQTRQKQNKSDTRFVSCDAEYWFSFNQFADETAKLQKTSVFCSS